MIKILCLGKLKEQYLTDLVNDYQKRISKYHKIEIIEIKDDIDQNKETKALMNNINKNDYLVLMDIKGDAYSSEEFASFIDKSFMEHGTITFIIGSSVGVSDEIKSICHKRISFSKLTMPHGLFRGVLLEQLYRAFKINNHESYHK
jgi:23S rRNA (pseudouridine1915-N3)-methyltransferase